MTLTDGSHTRSGSLAVWTGRAYRKESGANMPISIVNRVYKVNSRPVTKEISKLALRSVSTRLPPPSLRPPWGCWRRVSRTRAILSLFLMPPSHLTRGFRICLPDWKEKSWLAPWCWCLYDSDAVTQKNLVQRLRASRLVGLSQPHWELPRSGRDS